jgi:hypothetical protein
MTNEHGKEEQLRQLFERNSPPFDESAFVDRLEKKTSKVRRPASAPQRRRSGLRVAVYATAAVVVLAALTVGSLQLAKHLSADDDLVYITDPTDPATGSTGGTTATTAPTTPTTGGSTTPMTGGSAQWIGVPGDSKGTWAEIAIPGAPAEVTSVAISDDALLMVAPGESGRSLYAYLFDSGRMVELSTGASQMTWPDIQGTMAVWWEGTYDEASSSWSEQHIYSYDLATDEKQEIATGTENLGYPHISETWITWTEGKPWDQSPEEYQLMPIHGLQRASSGGTGGDPVELTASPVAAILGDATWTYSLSKDFLVWEQNAPEGGLDTGLYALDLATVPGTPRQVATEAWRPSLWEDKLVYSQDGVRFVDLQTGETQLIDADGDYPVAAPSYAVYYGSIEGTDGSGYSIIARGFTGGHEQVLSGEVDPPWLSTPVAASEGRIAFVTGQTILHVFEWQGQE